jgi:hypothetical protein
MFSSISRLASTLVLQGAHLRKSRCAPSWPWASVNYEIQIIMVSTPYAEVVDCTVEQVLSVKSSEQLIPGRLVLRAEVLRSDDVEWRDWLTRTDLDSTNTRGKNIYYVLLCRSIRKRSVGLILLKETNE